MITERRGVSAGVMLRDFIIFYIKLLLDGIKDVVLLQLALVAFGADVLLMLLTGKRRSRFFYSVLEVSERFDLWLNLHGAARAAKGDPDGLFAGSYPGDDTLLGEIEGLVRKNEAAARPAGPVRAPRPGIPGA